MRYIYDLHQTMIDHHLILVYEGEFTQEITKSVLAMAERNMDSTGEESSIKRKVFNVMVECLQNIVKHADHNNQDNAAVFLIGRSADSYIITSGNPIHQSEIAGLKQKLENINNLDKDGLKELYKDIIKNTQISDKGGAGLGFVDMARKSGQPLEFEFVELDNGGAFFCLKCSIPRA
ncbi:SiaB family protein kinase [Fulvivirga sedimenti]|uniref:SiaB family protein kinase n=1 Tax=Fulvivirga sedimenti TaxID=2879465 RepID=A0A9X1HVV0_9BACT|nr:SiaB family protein kinase [Fulvivirga sedimenti]MCA6077993.1 SiaB family protein kinase [Fulvivirga sedimenti]